ncbi:hypothetical protein G7K_1858-t1 [Saitoella complicata NRRL Y-17804]|uniref:Uncharacterized protein n=1 Tax=Saitoella complicata (strain BCRC 22490 / CBS 7301 / JCM 7358 / NBRC 10748 / NRRL Y-17804) TaxID=698492 RepID=A0A0E9NCU4_SAICN|nr:hypothetical protein G7K_1858-t1 [Saitoella complicata NRRL Y-17804]
MAQQPQKVRVLDASRIQEGSAVDRSTGARLGRSVRVFRRALHEGTTKLEGTTADNGSERSGLDASFSSKNARGLREDLGGCGEAAGAGMRDILAALGPSPPSPIPRCVPSSAS